MCFTTVYKKVCLADDLAKSWAKIYIKSEMTEEELQEKLFQLLRTRKTLIVLDDIWREEDWDMIEPIFPPGIGWKVLLTSRNEDVALRANPNSFTFRPDCLSLEESWTIFRRIVFQKLKNLTEYKVDEKMEELGKQMIKHCGGLPLALKVLGGLLVVHYTLDEWKRIYENIVSHIVGGTSFKDKNMSSVYHILYLSFEELPIYLKQCFLYFAQFPEDFTVDVEKLSYYWAAEEIPRPRYYDGATVREVGDRYIEELVKRNMVIAERDVRTTRFETCHMHDMMREVCLLKAEEENFLQFVHIKSTVNSKSLILSRRVVLQQRVIERSLKNLNIRSLLIIEELGWMESRLCFTRLQLMRVLDLQGAKFEEGELPSSIGLLIHLRYLSLYRAQVSHLPSSMRNLKQLLYLNLDVQWSYSIYMPNFMKEMRELTYLCLPSQIKDEVKIEMGNLVNLETLDNFSIKNSSVRDLHRTTRLTTLSVLFNSKGCAMETFSSSLSELRHLEVLTIWQRVHTNNRERFVLSCVNLKQLRLTIYMPSGRRMVCSGGGFPQLQKLIIDGLDKWDKWIVKEGSMPILHTLQITGCRKSKEVPDGLRFIYSLKNLTMDIKWEERLSEGGDDYYIVQHIPYVDWI